MNDRTQLPALADQERFWESWQEAKSITPWSLARADALLEQVRSLHLTNPNVLDLGCGTGWFAERLSSLGAVTGTDLSKKAMEEARARRRTSGSWREICSRWRSPRRRSTSWSASRSSPMSSTSPAWSRGPHRS